KSRIRVRFTRERRDIELLEGQALFHVAAENKRPFVVRSGTAQVRAIGTEFDVYRRNEGTTVTVVEGRVAVREEAVPRTLLLSAGEQVTVAPKTAPHSGKANVAAATAWTQRRLVFNSSPLPQVAEEFNRYNRRQLVIEDPALADFRISGVYSSMDPA